MSATPTSPRPSNSNWREWPIEAQRRFLEALRRRNQSAESPPPSLADFVHATCQFKLDPWQHVLCARLERLCTERGQRVLIHAPPQAGKPVWVGALVLMADGRRIPLADVSVGDVVISHRGRPCKVLAVHEQGERECVRITTNNGRSTSAALDHPFLTPEGWVNAGDLVPGQSLANVSEPECGGSTARADDEFEFLGYFMGDGACGPAGPSIQANVTSADPVQAARLMEVGARLGFACRVAQKQKTSALTYCFSGGVRDWLRNAGVGGKTSHFKTVPEWVFAGNRRQVALFLGAYFSCDGTVSPKGVGRNGEMRPDAAVEFYSVSQRLLQDVQSLLLRVGVQSRVSVKNARYLGNRHVSWRLSFKTLDAVAQFARVVPVPGEKGRKLRSLRACRKTFQPVLHGDPVVSVERVGLLPCRCLTVEADQTFTVDDLVVHNSVIISQRLPAYYLGRNPEGRVKLACYNITHATRFGKVGRDLMQDAAYRRLFPAITTSARQSGGEWSTSQRAALKDGQPSFAALGLVTGFVGQGASLLVIDDPYASPQDAASETIRESVWTFWDEAARVRLTDDANVVVMFHRYNEDDLAGRLMATDGLKEQGGKWELMRFAAVADGHGHDPMNRPVGEKLSPRWTDQYVADQQASGFAWDGQFQGLPGRKGGNMFQVDRLEFVAAAPALGQRCRGWDQAATAAGGDWTAGVKLCRGNDGLWYVEDVVRGQWDTAARNRVIRQTAELDGPACRVAGEQEPGSGGKDQAVAFVRLLAGFAAQVFPASGSKEVRADPLSAQVNAGNVRLVRGPWNKAFIDEVRQFPLGKNDDQVDAVAIAFRRLCRAVTVGAR